MKKINTLIMCSLCTTILLAQQPKVINKNAVKPVSNTQNIAAAVQAKDYLLRKLTTEFYIPPRTAGDAEFDGNGPDIKISCQLMIHSDRTKIIAVVYMKAKETVADWTTAEGTKQFVIFRCNPGQTIQELGQGSGYAKMDINFRDNNGHADQFLLPNGEVARTDAQNSGWALVNGIDHPSGVELVRVTGDTDGSEAGTRTGVELYFKPLFIKLVGPELNQVQLNAGTGIRTCGINTCGSSASATFISYHGIAQTCAQMKARLDASPNLINAIRSVSGYNIGLDPNSMRDRLNEIKNAFKLYEETNAGNLFSRIDMALKAKKPVIALTGWGSGTLRDIYANGHDPVSLNPNSVLHYIVIDGYNYQTETYSVIDNGTRCYMSREYLTNIVFWKPENAVVEGALYSNQVKPGKIIF